MYTKLLSLGGALLMLAGCAPYRLEYNHLVLNEVPGLTVVERSTPASMPEKDLKGARYDLPIRSTLAREAYTLTIYTPLHGETPMFLVGARSKAGEKLSIDGRDFTTVHPDALVLYPENPFVFKPEFAKGKRIEFEVRDSTGSRLGTERLEYRIVRRGVSWGVEWI